MGKPTLAELDILRSLVKFLRWVGGSPLSPSRNYQHLLREPPETLCAASLMAVLRTPTGLLFSPSCSVRYFQQHWRQFPSEKCRLGVRGGSRPVRPCEQGPAPLCQGQA